MAASDVRAAGEDLPTRRISRDAAGERCRAPELVELTMFVTFLAGGAAARSAAGRWPSRNEAAWYVRTIFAPYAGA
jgi:hypothetical protein